MRYTEDVHFLHSEFTVEILPWKIKHAKAVHVSFYTKNSLSNFLFCVSVCVCVKFSFKIQTILLIRN